MIKFQCPHCGREITTADDHAGKKGKCPACMGLMVVPASRPSAGKAAVQATPPRPAPSPVRPKVPPPARPPRPEPVEEEEDIPTVEAVEEEEALDVVPAEDEDVLDEEEERPRRATGKRSPARRRRRDEEANEDEEPIEEEERPRRKKRRKRSGDRWAPCPSCGSRDATRLHYTLWGGFIGPLLINHVRCQECGTAYNGKHGDYNTVRIAIFMGFVMVVGIGLAILGALGQRN